MPDEKTLSSLEIRSTIHKAGTLELSLVTTQIPEPDEGEVVVRVEASPINPSDLGMFFGPADMETAKASGTASAPIVTADVPAIFKSKNLGKPRRKSNVRNPLTVQKGNLAFRYNLLAAFCSSLNGGSPLC